jgi:acetyl-CoA carboxylase biotin carboxyl carrier protein
MSLTYGEVAEIIKIIDSSDCEELILETGGTRLVVRRGKSGAQPDTSTAASGASPAPPAQATTNAQDKPAAEASPKPSSEAKREANFDGTTVHSPMVGTFYRRPSPDESPFVESGATVKAGDTLCLIEVMKLYTSIEASCDGVVDAILADDGELVEFDQPLFVIRET